MCPHKLPPLVSHPDNKDVYNIRQDMCYIMLSKALMHFLVQAISGRSHASAPVITLQIYPVLECVDTVRFKMVAGSGQVVAASYT